MEDTTLKKLTGWHIGVGMAALFIGGMFGPLQKMEHAGIDLYSDLRGLGLQSYYQGLTLHGVLNALVWTTFFITGFLTFTTVESLGQKLKYPKLSWAAFFTMIAGLLLAAIAILDNQATVLFTFYPPLKASTIFYLGLTLVVIGSWITGYSLFYTYAAWRKANKGTQTPFIALASIITMVLWQIATLGIAIEMLWMLIPMSLGWIEGVDVQLARTFFWFTGHPLVYFWLLPAYISWYGMVPKQVGGKLFSEPLARLVFWMFLVLSTPVGFHHQYTDPGIPAGWKFVHTILTLAVFFPSMLTAFNVIASLEIGGRARGGKGLLGWIRTLPWDNPSFVTQNLAMILFAFGGISGIVNASYNVNLTVHNTIWVPGHFHLTVGTAVTLSFFGIAYWLVPKLSNKPLFSRKMGVWQGWTWFVGMILMSNSLHMLGLQFQIPRRTSLGVSPYIREILDTLQPFLTEAMIGGIILGISGLLFYINMAGTVFSRKELTEKIEMPVAESADQHPAPAWLDNWKPWMVGTVALILISYLPVLVWQFSQLQMNAPGFRFW